MNPLRREEKERLLNYCFGLTFAEEAANIEAWIAHDEEAARLHAGIQAALGPLESLPPEPCPEELAERTIHRLCVAARGSPETKRTKIICRRVPNWEELWLCLSNNILMK